MSKPGWPSGRPSGSLSIPAPHAGYRDGPQTRRVAPKQIDRGGAFQGEVFQIVDHNMGQRPDDGMYGNANLAGGNRTILITNIRGNNYRLVVKINYPHRVVYIRFAGTHAEHDAVDVKEVRDGQHQANTVRRGS